MYQLYDYLGNIISEETPQKYGAIANGQMDCSGAIETLISSNISGTIYFPPGVYAVSRPIKTYGRFETGPNIIFDPCATIVPLAQMDYLLDIGGLTESTTKIYGKQIIHGGIFRAENGYVTKAAICIRAFAHDVDFGYANIFTAGCSGVFVGEQGKSSSTDAYLHHLNIKHSNEVNSNSGITFYSFDNNVSNCRVYYYGININCQVGGQLFTDIHTLANGKYDADQVAVFVTGDVHLTNFYSDSEDTFIRTADTGDTPRIFMCNCIYYSYKTNNVVVFDIANNAIIKANGLKVTCKANTQYIGVKAPYSSFKQIFNPVNFDLDGIYIQNPEYMQDGDPLKGMQTSGKEVYFNPTNMTNGTWYKVGSLAVNDTIESCITMRSSNGTTKIPLSVKCTSSGILSADVSSGEIITTDDGVYQIGYKLNNAGFDSTSEYPLVDVYVKRYSGNSRTLYRFDIETNLMTRLSRSGDYLTTLSSETVTPDIVCNIDCSNGTVSVAM